MNLTEVCLGLFGRAFKGRSRRVMELGMVVGRGLGRRRAAAESISTTSTRVTGKWEAWMMCTSSSLQHSSLPAFQNSCIIPCPAPPSISPLNHRFPTAGQVECVEYVMDDEFCLLWGRESNQTDRTVWWETGPGNSTQESSKGKWDGERDGPFPHWEITRAKRNACVSAPTG